MKVISDKLQVINLATKLIFGLFLFSISYFLFVPEFVFAQVNNVPQVDISRTPTDGPFGGFKLSVCDGPDYSGISASSKDFPVDYEGKTYQIPSQINSLRAAGYVPCNFQGLMIQIQFLINTMLVLGVLAAIIGFAYAGFKYIATPIADKKSEASKMFPKIFWGFIIMLTAWFVVHQILVWLTGDGNAFLK